MDNFLEQARKQLTSCENPEEILAELNDHIDENKKYFEDIGYFGDACTEKVNEAMGDGEIIGQRLNEQNRKRNIKIQILIAVLIIVINYALSVYFALPSYENTFVRPFFTGIVILIIDYAFTIFAIKLKSKLMSFVLALMCFLTLHLSATKLSYPMTNIILAKNNGFGIFYVYNLISLAGTAIILLSVFLPNIYNIYYCNRIKNLKNTRKQYYFTKKICTALFVFSIITAISAYPLFALNQSLVKRQQETRDEFVEFVYDVSTRFDGAQISEIENFLRNCDYEFFETGNQDDKNSCWLIYYKGNWSITASLNYDDETYSLYMQNLIYNSSQPYLFFGDYEQESRILEQIGSDEFDSENGPCIGMTRDELHSKMQETNFCQFYCSNCIGDYAPENTSFYSRYDWYLDNHLYSIFGHDSYAFFYDENDKCISYDLTLD